MPVSTDSFSQNSALGGDEIIGPALARFPANEQFWQSTSGNARGCSGPQVDSVRALLKSS